MRDEMRKEAGDVIADMFVPAAVSMIYAASARFLANTIDGVITSKYLGLDAYAGVALFSPMVNIILLFAMFVGIGGQALSARQIGSGEKEQANAVFSFTVIAGLAVTAVFLLLGVFAPDLLFRICGISSGGTPQIYGYMTEYMRGYLLGIPALILVQVLSPFLVMDNGKKRISAAAAVLFVSDVAGDLLNVTVFGGGMFGMGAATSLSLFLQLLVLLRHFLSRSSYFVFSLRGFRTSFLWEITKNGGLTVLRTLATICRDLFTNHLNLSLAVGMAAVAAKGIQTDLNTLMFCLGIGISGVLLPMSSMFYGADDRNGMKRLFACAMKTSVTMSGGTGAAMFLLAPFIAGFYTDEPEVLSFAIFGIRCMAVGLIFDTVSVVYQSYLQGIQRLQLVNFLCFAERFFIPIIVAFVLGLSFGPEGVLASIAVSKLVLIVMMFVIVCFYRKGFPKGEEDYMILPEGFGVEEGSELYFTIRTLDEAVIQSKAAGTFCVDHGTDSDNAYMVALFVEEMAVNVLTHGISKNKKSVSVDFRIYAKHGRITLSLRDYCEAFNPARFYEIHKDEDISRTLGIRVIMKMAGDNIRYVNTFNSNCIMLLLEES